MKTLALHHSKANFVNKVPASNCLNQTSALALARLCLSEGRRLSSYNQRKLSRNFHSCNGCNVMVAQKVSGRRVPHYIHWGKQVQGAAHNVGGALRAAVAEHGRDDSFT